MSTYPTYIPEDTPLGLPNCGVISTAMICGISHEEAWQAIAQERPKGSIGSWKGRTYDTERHAVMKSYGVVFERLPRFFGTLNQWLQSDQYQRSSTYEVCVTDHAMTLHRGRFFDQNQSKRGLPARESPFLRSKMAGVIKIISGSPLRDGLNTEAWL